MIHREQQAEPHFCAAAPPLSLFLNSSPSPPLSKSYQAVISKSGVIWALPWGGAQLKLCLAQIRDTKKTAGTSLRLTSCPPFLQTSLSLSLSLHPSLSSFSVSPTFCLCLSSPPSLPRFNFFIVLIIQSQFCLAVILFVLSHLDEKTPAANWPIRPAPDDIIATCMEKKSLLLSSRQRQWCASLSIIEVCPEADFLLISPRFNT